MTTLVPRLPSAHKREVLFLAILAFASNWFTGVLGAQAVPDESDRFEVASIRPSGAQDRPAMEFLPGGGIRAANVTLKLLVQIAYDIRPEQLSGGPGWAESDEYTVVANDSDATALSKTPARGVDACTPTNTPE
jgi:hypothetical protein